MWERYIEREEERYSGCMLFISNVCPHFFVDMKLKMSLEYNEKKWMSVWSWQRTMINVKSLKKALNWIINLKRELNIIWFITMLKCNLKIKTECI